MPVAALDIDSKITVWGKSHIGVKIRTSLRNKLINIHKAVTQYFYYRNKPLQAEREKCVKVCLPTIFKCLIVIATSSKNVWSNK